MVEPVSAEEICAVFRDSLSRSEINALRRNNPETTFKFRALLAPASPGTMNAVSENIVNNYIKPEKSEVLI